MTIPSLFTGLSAFPITPADADGRVEINLLDGILSRIKAAKVDSVGLLGSTGTYPYLSRSERRRTIDAATEQMNGEVPVIVGIGALRTSDAVLNALDARDAGADGLLLSAMSYYPLTQDEVFEHFKAVAAATDLPICIYNNEVATHFKFTPDLLAQLGALDNISAIKGSGVPADDFPENIKQLRDLMPENFAVGYSGDWLAPAGMMLGSDAWYSVVGGLFPAPALALTRAAQANDQSEFQRLNALFEPLWPILKAHSGVRVMYAAANLLELTNTQPPRPLLPLSKDVHDQIATAIKPLLGFS